MNFQHSKEVMVREFQGCLGKAYKRKKLKNLPEHNEVEAKKARIEEDGAVDMDMDSESEEAVATCPPCPVPETPTSPDLPIENNDADTPASPSPEPQPQPPPNPDDDSSSLQELERKQHELLKQLENENDVVIDELIENVSSPVAVGEPVEDSEDKPKGESPIPTGIAVESHYGTPLLKQVSPFDRTPDSDKWAVGVTDVIDFENLPNSIGKYKKMRGLISKVRTVVQRINDDNDNEEDDC